MYAQRLKLSTLCSQAFQSMVKRAAMQRSAECHAGALMSAVGDELAAVKRCFEAVRQEPFQVQGGRTALPRLAGGALAASHLIRRITATWTSLQVCLLQDWLRCPAPPQFAQVTSAAALKLTSLLLITY